MENQLTSLERKIDDLLASVDDQHRGALNASASHHDVGEASGQGGGAET